MDKKNHRIASAIIIFFCLFLYGNTLENDYALDDEYVIVGNPLVKKGVKAIPKIFVSPYVKRENVETHSYRPVTIATFAIEYELFEADPAVSHFINLLIYALTCLVLFKLLLRLFKDYHWYLALITTLIFLLLPVHTEVVNNIKSRDELLCFLFAILSLAQFIKYADHKRIISLLLGIIFIVLSLMSKLSSITFLAIIPLTLWFFTEIKGKKIAMVVGSLLLVIIAIRMGISQVFEGEEGVDRELFYENPFYVDNPGFLGRIPMAFYTVGYYLKLLIFPKSLICYYGYNQVPIVGWGNWLFWVSALPILSVSGFAIYKIKTRAIWIYGVLYFIIAISMFSNLVLPAVGIIAERFVYIPSLGFSISIGYLIFKLLKIEQESGKVTMTNKSMAYLVLSLIVIISSGRIITRNGDWKDKETLLRHDVAEAPNSAKLNALLANDLFFKIFKERSPNLRKQLVDEAIGHYRKSVEVFPRYATSWNNMGTLYFNERRDFVTAKQCYIKAIENKQDYPEALFSLGYCYELDKDYQKAADYFNQVLKLQPRNQRAIDHLNNVQQYIITLE